MWMRWSWSYSGHVTRRIMLRLMGIFMRCGVMGYWSVSSSSDVPCHSSFRCLDISLHSLVWLAGFPKASTARACLVAIVLRTIGQPDDWCEMTDHSVISHQYTAQKHQNLAAHTQAWNRRPPVSSFSCYLTLHLHLHRITLSRHQTRQHTPKELEHLTSQSSTWSSSTFASVVVALHRRSQNRHRSQLSQMSFTSRSSTRFPHLMFSSCAQPARSSSAYAQTSSEQD